jgi:predicted aminopeptidase
VRGQLELFNRAIPIADALANPRLDERYRRALGEIPQIKKFGETQGLKPTSNYQEFVELHRDAVVYVVSGCESLRFEALRWSFPVVGGFTYLGWFDREQALRMRDRLTANGYDADVRGAAAFSTLGWFRDPVLSTLIGPNDPYGFIETLLHESVHATVFFDSQSTFNESLAQFIAEKLTPIYLEKNRTPEDQARYLEELGEERRRGRKIRERFQELKSLYASDKPDLQKLEAKRQILGKLKQELGWPESRMLNNATLVQFSTYGSGQEGFEALWSGCGGSLGRFLEVLKGAEQKFKGAPDAELDGILKSLSC